VRGLALLRRGRLRSRTFCWPAAVVVAAPVAWFVYNAVGFGDWLYFVRGLIRRRLSRHAPPLRAFRRILAGHNPWVALIFFVKTAELDAAAVPGARAAGREPAGNRLGLADGAPAGLRVALLLWFPVAFYVYSVSYGSVPFFAVLVAVFQRHDRLSRLALRR